LKIYLPIKINTTLKIRGIDNRGYHLIESVFLALRGGDAIKIEPSERFRVLYRGKFAQEPRRLSFRGEDTVSRAYAILKSRDFHPHPVRVEVFKNIPPGSGLGAGSADAASIFYYFWEKGILSEEEAISLSGEVGSDVPFFVGVLLKKRVLWRVSGRGDRIEPDSLENFQKKYLVVVPDITMSTAEVYRKYDELRLRGYDFDEYSNHLFPAALDLDVRLGVFYKIGFKMTGSGSAFFTEVDDGKKVRELVKKVKKKATEAGFGLSKIFVSGPYDFRGVLPKK